MRTDLAHSSSSPHSCCTALTPFWWVSFPRCPAALSRRQPRQRQGHGKASRATWNPKGPRDNCCPADPLSSKRAKAAEPQDHTLTSDTTAETQSENGCWFPLLLSMALTFFLTSPKKWTGTTSTQCFQMEHPKQRGKASSNHWQNIHNAKTTHCNLGYMNNPISSELGAHLYLPARKYLLSVQPLSWRISQHQPDTHGWLHVWQPEPEFLLILTQLWALLLGQPKIFQMSHVPSSLSSHLSYRTDRLKKPTSKVIAAKALCSIGGIFSG